MSDQPTNEAQDEKSYCDVCGQSPARTCYSSYAHLCSEHYGEQKDKQQPVENNENSEWFCRIPNGSVESVMSPQYFNNIVIIGLTTLRHYMLS